MRLLLATGLIALATPALAQRVDTRIDDVRPTADGLSCRAHAHPDLLMIEGAGTRPPSATIAYKALEDSGYDDLRLIVALTPRGSTMVYVEGKHVGMEVAGFRLRTTDFPDTPVAEALLSLDGKPDPAKILLSREGRPPVFDLRIDDGGALAQRMVQAEKAQLILLDAAKKPLARYNWNVGRLRYAIELPLLWRWRCLPQW